MSREGLHKPFAAFALSRLLDSAAQEQRKKREARKLHAFSYLSVIRPTTNGLIRRHTFIISILDKLVKSDKLI